MSVLATTQPLAVLRSRSEVARTQGDAARARIAGLHELGLLAYLPKALVDLAQSLERLGQGPEARAGLLEACARVGPMHAPMLEWMVRYALGKFEAEHGGPAEGNAAWDRAREIVNAIAANVPTVELRASFLARADVRSLLGGVALTRPAHYWAQSA